MEVMVCQYPRCVSVALPKTIGASADGLRSDRNAGRCIQSQIGVTKVQTSCRSQVAVANVRGLPGTQNTANWKATEASSPRCGMKEGACRQSEMEPEKWKVEVRRSHAPPRLLVLGE